MFPPMCTLGIHFCFGTFGGWPRLRVNDLGAAVELTNAAIEASVRPVDWVHIPALPVTDDAFYAPLKANLQSPRSAGVHGTHIHNMESFPERLAVAEAQVPARLRYRSLLRPRPPLTRRDAASTARPRERDPNRVARSEVKTLTFQPFAV